MVPILHAVDAFNVCAEMFQHAKKFVHFFARRSSENHFDWFFWGLLNELLQNLTHALFIVTNVHKDLNVVLLQICARKG